MNAISIVSHVFGFTLAVLQKEWNTAIWVAVSASWFYQANYKN